MITVGISSIDGTYSAGFSPVKYEKFTIRTSKHGDSSLDIKAVVGSTQARVIAETRNARFVRVFSDGVPLWKGILTDATADSEVVEFSALGMWSILKQQPISGFWSHTLASEWFEPENSDTTFSNSRYSVSNDGRLFIGLKANEDYADPPRAAWIWEAPHEGLNNIEEFSFTYDVTLPTGYRAIVISADYDNGSLATEWSIDGDGTQKTGSGNITGMSVKRLIFDVHRHSTATTYTDETDEFYAYLDSLRVKGTDSATLDIPEIVGDVYAQGASENSSIVDAGFYAPALSLDIQDAYYEDAPISSVIQLAEEYGDGNGDPLLFNLDRHGFATMKKQSEAGDIWYAIVTGVAAKSSLDGYANNLYVKYPNENDFTRRTASASAKNDLAPGITFTDFIEFKTTSESEAEAARDAVLEANAISATKANIRVAAMYSQYSTRSGLEFVRGGDRLIIQNYSLQSQAASSDLYYFTIVDATYDVLNDALKLTLGRGNDDQRDAIVEALVGEFEYVDV